MEPDQIGQLATAGLSLQTAYTGFAFAAGWHVCTAAIDVVKFLLKFMR